MVSAAIGGVKFVVLLQNFENSIQYFILPMKKNAAPPPILFCKGTGGKVNGSQKLSITYETGTLSSPAPLSDKTSRVYPSVTA